MHPLQRYRFAERVGVAILRRWCELVFFHACGHALVPIPVRNPYTRRRADRREWS